MGNIKILVRTTKRNIIVEAKTAKEALEQVKLDYLERVVGVRPIKRR